VRHRDAGEGLEVCLAEDLEGAFGQLAGGRTRELAMDPIELDQPGDIGRSEAT